jgi:hypothetical protein
MSSWAARSRGRFTSRQFTRSVEWWIWTPGYHSKVDEVIRPDAADRRVGVEAGQDRIADHLYRLLFAGRRSAEAIQRLMPASRADCARRHSFPSASVCHRKDLAGLIQQNDALVRKLALGIQRNRRTSIVYRRMALRTKREA